MDNCAHGVDSRNQCIECALVAANADADQAERALRVHKAELATKHAAIVGFRAQLAAADALADALTAFAETSYTADDHDVVEALAAYRRLRGER